VAPFGADAGDDLDPSSDRARGDSRNTPPLVIAQRRDLAGVAIDDDPVDARKGGHPSQVVGQPLFVDIVVVVKRA